MLGFNPVSGAFYLAARTPALVQLAADTGMDRSVPATAKYGCPVYVTHSRYAALTFWRWADPAARDELFNLQLDYEASYDTGEGCAYAPPEPEGETFMPFQRAGIRRSLDILGTRKGALVGDEPGLGKTITAVGVANGMDAKRVLVICPASVRLHWEDKIRLWSMIPKLGVHLIDTGATGVSPLAHYTVVSYDLARTKGILHALMAFEYDLLVLDEAHYLKSIDARRSRAVFGQLRQVPNKVPPGEGEAGLEVRANLGAQAQRILALTGTPLPNRPRECYNLVRHLDWDTIDRQSEDVFRSRYNPSFTLPSGSVWEEKGRLPELRARLRCNLMVRRLKRQVLTQLPDKRYELAYVEPNGEIRKVLAAETLLDIDPDHLEDIDPEVWGDLSSVRKEMGIAKVPRVVEFVTALLQSGEEKVLVFAHHREVIARLTSALHKFGCVKLDGSTPMLRRAQNVKLFQDDPHTRVFVGQLQAAGTGIDGLQHATARVVFAEASWTPGVNEQCVDRLHRYGQKWAVLAQFLVASGSLDERILGRAIEKYQITHEALDA